MDPAPYLKGRAPPGASTPTGGARFRTCVPARECTGGSSTSLIPSPASTLRRESDPRLRGNSVTAPSGDTNRTRDGPLLPCGNRRTVVSAPDAYATGGRAHRANRRAFAAPPPPVPRITSTRARGGRAGREREEKERRSRSFADMVWLVVDWVGDTKTGSATAMFRFQWIAGEAGARRGARGG